MLVGDPQNIERYILDRKNDQSLKVDYRLPEQPLEREISRDKWQGLGVDNKGFPQGANTSPFLTCLAVQRVCGNFSGLLMYVDDGLLFGETREEVENKINLFKEKLTQIGVSLAEEKSRWIREGDEIKSFKFLGLRLDEEMLRSETRSGTVKPIELEPYSFEDFDKLANFLEIPWNEALYYWLKVNGIPQTEHLDKMRETQPSNTRIVDWIQLKAKDKAAGLTWAVEKGFFSKLVAQAFDPVTESSTILSQQGVTKALEAVFKRRNSVAAKAAKRRWTRYEDINITLLSSQTVLDTLRTMRRVQRKRGRRS